MSKWTHRACSDCFNKRHPGKIPHKVKNHIKEPCCYCKKMTWTGIYDRNDPNKTPCGGNHEN